MDMIERVARALSKHSGDKNEDDWEWASSYARAAIEAMREPHKPAFAQDLNDIIWNRKIDAALTTRERGQ